MIKSKVFGIIGFIWFEQGEVVCFLICLNDTVTSTLFLFLIHWSDSDHDFDGFTHMEGFFSGIFITSKSMY